MLLTDCRRTPRKYSINNWSAAEGQFVDGLYNSIVKTYNVITYLLSIGHDPFAIYFFR